MRVFGRGGCPLAPFPVSRRMLKPAANSCVYSSVECVGPGDHQSKVPEGVLEIVELDELDFF